MNARLSAFIADRRLPSWRNDARDRAKSATDGLSGLFEMVTAVFGPQHRLCRTAVVAGRSGQLGAEVGLADYR